MIISVASGKGGTGKTTISTNLALSLDRQVKLLDCDVEEPNSHLFIRPEFERRESVTTFVPKFAPRRCTGCRKCIDICRFNALTMVGGAVLSFPELCHSCEGCLAVCPEQAVAAGTRELGFIETGRRGTLAFVRGCLRIGEAMSPPLIRRVRREIVDGEVAIIDAPPGTSCPVIAAMDGSDFILLVTEPTPFGLHDFSLAVEAATTLGIPCGLVINRADIGDDTVRDYARRRRLPILMEIPYDRRIAELCSQGRCLVDELPHWRDSFRSLFTAISAICKTPPVVS